MIFVAKAIAYVQNKWKRTAPNWLTVPSVKLNSDLTHSALTSLILGHRFRPIKPDNREDFSITCQVIFRQIFRVIFPKQWLFTAWASVRTKIMHRVWILLAGKENCRLRRKQWSSQCLTTTISAVPKLPVDTEFPGEIRFAHWQFFDLEGLPFL